MSSHKNDCARGPRGPRGKRGHRGDEGPQGPVGGGGLLKFSGDLTADPTGLPASSWLADAGTQLVLNAVSYPAADERSLVNLATRLSTVVPSGGSVQLELLLNGVALPGFAVSYGAGETGVKAIAAGPVVLASGDRLDLRGTTEGFVGFTVLQGVSATVGIE